MSSSVVSKPARYHPVSVILHWAVVLLIVAAGSDVETHYSFWADCTA